MFRSFLDLDVNVENSSSLESILMWGLRLFRVGRREGEREDSTVVLIFFRHIQFFFSVLMIYACCPTWVTNPWNYSIKQSSSTNPLKSSQVKGVFECVFVPKLCSSCIAGCM